MIICQYGSLSRLKMEQLDKEKSLVVIPLGALEQHGKVAEKARM